MLPRLLLAIVLLYQHEVPYKPNEEFELNVDYKFRQRPEGGATNLLDPASPAGPLPYLTIKIKILKLKDDEVRYKVVTNKGNQVLGKKAEVSSDIQFEMGFTDDLKDRVQPYEYTVLFLSSDRKEKSKIVVSVEQDGTFLVNGAKRGKL